MQPGDISTLASLLAEDIAEFDCARLCRGEDGLAYCCKIQNFVPVLFREEQSFWNEQGGLWQEYMSENTKELQSRDQIFCTCNFSSCLRDLRSLSCRTYPLEPYFDRSGRFAGLTFLSTANEVDRETGRLRCPLSRQFHHIRQAFINNTTLFFDQLLKLKPDEKEAYLESSRRHRKRHRECGIQIVVLKAEARILDQIQL